MERTGRIEIRHVFPASRRAGPWRHADWDVMRIARRGARGSVAAPGLGAV